MNIKEKFFNLSALTILSMVMIGGLATASVVAVIGEAEVETQVQEPFDVDAVIDGEPVAGEQFTLDLTIDNMADATQEELYEVVTISREDGEAIEDNPITGVTFEYELLDGESDHYSVGDQESHELDSELHDGKVYVVVEAQEGIFGAEASYDKDFTFDSSTFTDSTDYDVEFGMMQESPLEG